MKKLFLILLSGTLIFMSCKKDETIPVLGYDGENDNAPTLPIGTFDAGVRFPKNILDNHIGRTLEEVEFYIQDQPSDVEILIYGEGSATEPGSTILYSQNVNSSVSANSWITHTLTSPIIIADEDIWVVVRLVHDSEMRSIGCDVGPARTNGDWMLGEGQSEWRTYRDISNGVVSVNWNIRAYMSEE